MKLREAIKATMPENHGLFYAALVKAEAEEGFDRVDQIFSQVSDRAHALCDSVDDKYADNDWPIIDIVDEIVDWITENPSR